VAPEGKFADLTPAELAAIREMAEPVSQDELVYLLRAFMDADAEMRRSPHPRVELEIAAVRAARRPRPEAIESLIAKIDEATSRLRSGPAGLGRPVAAQPSLLDAAPRTTPPVSGSSVPAPAVAESRPPRRQEPAPESVSEGDLGRGWTRAVEEILKKKALLGSVVQHAVPQRLEGGVLTVGLIASAFHREMLGERANREIITQAVQQHIPGARRVEIASEGDVPSGAVNHPAVQAAVATFQGEVVAVRPRVPEEGEGQ